MIYTPPQPTPRHMAGIDVVRSAHLSMITSITIAWNEHISILKRIKVDTVRGLASDDSALTTPDGAMRVVPLDSAFRRAGGDTGNGGPVSFFDYYP